MGLFNMFTSQFIEVIELQMERDDLILQFPVNKNEIKMGAKLIVREGQIAVFVNEGQIADIFEAGTYELNTQNMPIMTKLKSWKYGFNSPFKAEVYFINKIQLTDQKWGTPNPVIMRDKDFGIIRLRGFGNFSYRVFDAMTIIKEFSGSIERIKIDVATENFKKLIVSSLSEVIANMNIPVLDLAMRYSEISNNMKLSLDNKFKNLGFEIVEINIENLSLPQEIENSIDNKTKMGVLGDLNQYTKLKMAESIGNNNSNFTNASVEMATAAMMMNMMNQNMQNNFNYNQNPNIQNGFNYNQNPNMQNSVSYNQNPNMQNGFNYNQNPNMQNGFNYNQNPNMQNGFNYNQNPNMQNGFNYNQDPNMQNGFNYNQDPNIQNNKK